MVNVFQKKKTEKQNTQNFHKWAAIALDNILMQQLSGPNLMLCALCTFSAMHVCKYAYADDRICAVFYVTTEGFTIQCAE